MTTTWDDFTTWADFWKQQGREFPICSQCGNITLYPTTGVYTREGECVYGPNAPGLCNHCVESL